MLWCMRSGGVSCDRLKLYFYLYLHCKRRLRSACRLKGVQALADMTLGLRKRIFASKCFQCWNHVRGCGCLTFNSSLATFPWTLCSSTAQHAKLLFVYCCRAAFQQDKLRLQSSLIAAGTTHVLIDYIDFI